MTVTRRDVGTPDRPTRGGAAAQPELSTRETHPGQAPALSDWVVEELRALIARLALRLDDLERFLPLRAADDTSTSFEDAPCAGQDADSDVGQHADLTDWVDSHFAAVYSRPIGGQWRWCPRWSEHPEAVERLGALWQTWQASQQHFPLGMATWLRDHLDHHLPILLGPAGPFAGCSPERHESHRGLPVQAL